MTVIIQKINLFSEKAYSLADQQAATGQLHDKLFDSQ